MNCLKTVLLFLFLIGMAGCGDDDNPTTLNDVPVEPLYFAIYANPRGEVDDPSAIFFEFSMELLDELPVVVANGKTIEGFYYQGASINGYLNLPMAATIDFSVTSGAKTISGTIDMPTRVDEVSCNGIVLQDGNFGNELDATDSYQFEWSGGDADFFACFFEMRDNSPDNSSFWHHEFTNSWTLDEETGSPFTFSVTAVNGSGLGPGASPYVTSNWAAGYVNSFDFRNSYWFSGETAQHEIWNGLSARARLMGQIQSR